MLSVSYEAVTLYANRDKKADHFFQSPVQRTCSHPTDFLTSHFSCYNIIVLLSSDKTFIP